MARSRPSRECVYAVKGSGLVVPQTPPPRSRKSTVADSPVDSCPAQQLQPPPLASASAADIQRHLQDMLALIRPEDHLRMAVRLESIHSGRTRYLAVVASGLLDECCLLGIDSQPLQQPLQQHLQQPLQQPLQHPSQHPLQQQSTIGLVRRVLAETEISLDGDGGIVVRNGASSHIYKPVSVQAMWSALQTLHKCRLAAPRATVRPDDDWVSPYERRVASDQSCLNEWHAMADIEYPRPSSPDRIADRATEKEATERVIRCRLREIMVTVDLDQVTAKQLRGRLEQQLGRDLSEFKAYVDQEMLTIMGQLDRASRVFDHLYLGSEWNASDVDELKKNGVGYILNVTREIDNFFPGRFQYMNVRVYDEEATELLRHWDNTYKFIEQTKKEGGRVLVHCRMGVSRSAAVVVAYAMKAHGWSYQKAMRYVRERRACVKPNPSFLKQLEIYQGILDASKQRHKWLWRSKSETNLKRCRATPSTAAAATSPVTSCRGSTQEQRPDEHQLRTPDRIPVAVPTTESDETPGERPKSWSPEESLADALITQMDYSPVDSDRSRLPGSAGDGSCSGSDSGDGAGSFCPPPPPPLPPSVAPSSTTRRVPCNGHDYSVSQNQALNLSLSSDPFSAGPASPPSSDGSCPAGGGVVFECVNPRLLVTAGDCAPAVVGSSSPEARWVGQVVALRSAPPGLVRRQAEDFERRSSSCSESAAPAPAAAVPSAVDDSWSSLEGVTLRRAASSAHGAFPSSPSRSSSWGSYDTAPAALMTTSASGPERRLSRLESGVARLSAQLMAGGGRAGTRGRLGGTVSMLDLTAGGATSSDEDGAVTPGQVRRMARWLEARDSAAAAAARRCPPGSDSCSGAAEDELSVRSLVGRFETGGGSQRAGKQQRRLSAPLAPPTRKGSLHFATLASLTRRNLGQVFRRRPQSSTLPAAAPPVVRVSSKPPPPPPPPAAAPPSLVRRRLHGKTHPLAKLDVRTRHPLF